MTQLVPSDAGLAKQAGVMSGVWPGDVRCVVVLNFDVDGELGAINRNPDAARLPSLMSMWEYGPSVGAPRILGLLDEYGIKASFYIPGYVAQTHESLVLDIRERGHEINPVWSSCALWT